MTTWENHFAMKSDGVPLKKFRRHDLGACSGQLITGGGYQDAMSNGEVLGRHHLYEWAGRWSYLHQMRVVEDVPNNHVSLSVLEANGNFATVWLRTTKPV